MTMKLLTGGCHCCNIEYQFHLSVAAEVLPLRACTCSYCTAQSAVYTSDHNGHLAVSVKDEKLIGRYQFASKVADFIFCQTCGVMPFVIAKINGQLYAVININTLDSSLNRAQITHVELSNETVTAGQQRRSQIWIPSVTGLERLYA